MTTRQPLQRPVPAHSIERKLPLFLCLLLSIVVTALAWFALDEVYAFARQAANERMYRVVRQLGVAVEESIPTRYAEMREAAASPGVRRLRAALDDSGPDSPLLVDVTRDARGGDDFATLLSASAADVSAAPLYELAQANVQVAMVAIVSDDGQVRFAALGGAAWDRAPGHVEIPAEVRAELDAPREPDAPPPAVTDRFRVDRDHVYYDAWVALEPVDGRTEYLLQRRRVSDNPGGADFLRNIIGIEASFVLGNAAGDLWTDLAGRVEGPPLRLLDEEDGEPHSRAGETWFGSAVRVEGTPWAVWVGQPERVVLSNARDALERIAMMAVGTVMIGLLGAVMISRRLTSPLNQLTSAALELAQGRYSRRVEIRRRDELGVLAQAFNSMADQVEEASTELEARVARRTEELRAAQEELVRKERLAVLGQLAGGIGHELRNPLGVMSNAVYLLRIHEEDLPERVVPYVEMLERQIKLSGKIVEDLLGMTRVQEPDHVDITVAELVESARERTRIPASARVEASIDRGLPSVRVDPVQVGQVLHNLFVNAIQAADGPVVLEVSAARVPDDRLEIRVADDGPGVPPESVDKIFEPLYTTKARGIGLGLSISRTLARANGGDLWLESAGGRGEGAVFVLSLPTSSVSGEGVHADVGVENA